jgi:hypothetical protein
MRLLAHNMLACNAKVRARRDPVETREDAGRRRKRTKTRERTLSDATARARTTAEREGESATDRDARSLDAARRAW